MWKQRGQAWGDEWTWRANAGFWNHWNDTARRDLVKQCMYEATCEEKMEDTKAKSGDTGDPVSLQEQYDDAEFDILEMECTLTGCTDDAQLVEYGKELQELKGKLKDLEKKLAGAG